MKRAAALSLVIVVSVCTIADGGPLRRWFGRNRDHNTDVPYEAPLDQPVCQPGMPCYQPGMPLTTGGAVPDPTYAGRARIGRNQSIEWVGQPPAAVPGITQLPQVATSVPVQSTLAPVPPALVVSPAGPSTSVTVSSPAIAATVSAPVAAAPVPATAVISSPTPAPTGPAVPAAVQAVAPSPVTVASVPVTEEQNDDTERLNRFIDAVAQRLDIEDEVDPPTLPARQLISDLPDVELKVEYPDRVETATIDLTDYVRLQLGAPISSEPDPVVPIPLPE